MDGFILVAGILAALGLLFLLRQQWTPTKLKETNEISGFYIGAIGTIYAVSLAFMLSGVWLEFEAAQVNTEKEANCLVSFFRLASGLSNPQRNQLEELAQAYAKVMIDEEWDAMRRKEVSARGVEIIETLWKEVTRMEVHTSGEQEILNHLISELTSMTEHRRIRMLQSKKSLPGILWAVLIVGGIVTVGTSCFFGVDSLRLHTIHTIMLTLLVSLMLIAIADISRPFDGVVHVEPEGFKLALETMNVTKGK
jgi:Protein of unknown function (DUF4239)